VAARRGRAKAAVAVAHSILIIAYHVLTERTIYCDLGGNDFDARDHQGLARRPVHRLPGLEYGVTFVPRATSAAEGKRYLQPSAAWPGGAPPHHEKRSWWRETVGRRSPETAGPRPVP
jgi:hypothetical protein